MRALISSSLLLLSVAAWATEPVTIQTAVTPPVVTIGDRVTYTITAQHPAGVTVTPPEKMTELGAWEVKDLKTAPLPQQGATSFTYTLTTFSTGTITIPALAFRFTDHQTTGTVTASSTTVQVESVLAKDGPAPDIRDIKPPLSLPLPLGVYLLWLAILAAAGAGLWYWYRVYRTKNLPEATVPAEPPVPPYQKALEALEQLKAAGLVAEGRIKEFYIALTDIMRDYLAGVYAIDTRDRTTAEIFAQLKKAETDKKVLAAVRDFFDECDLVKFAKYRPEEPVCWQDWQQAKDIVTNGTSEHVRE